MAFTYDPTTTLGRLREKIGDLYTDSPLFDDEELENILSEYNDNLNLAAAEALRRLLIRPRLLRRWGDAIRAEDLGQLLAMLREQIEQYEAEAVTEDAQVWERDLQEAYQDLISREL